MTDPVLKSDVDRQQAPLLVARSRDQGSRAGSIVGSGGIGDPTPSGRWSRNGTGPATGVAGGPAARGGPEAAPEPAGRSTAAPAPPWSLGALAPPPGTAWFAFRTWVALAVAYYAAFWLELDGASSAGVTVLILAQPQQGMVLSKAVYRIAATLVGVAVAITLTALFPQDRTMLLASFAVFMAAQTALGSVYRDFRSYACVLAGYTVAIVSLADVDAPVDAFASAVNRVSAIALGIVAIAVTNMVLRTPDATRPLVDKLRGATADVVALALDVMDHRRRPDASTRVDLAARLMPLRGEITFATWEKPNGRARAAGGRSALLALLEAISAIQAIGAGLSRPGPPSATVDEAVVLTREAVRLQSPEKRLPALEAVALARLAAGRLSVDEAFVLDHLMSLLEAMGLLRDGLRALRLGRRPRRRVAIPVHVDWFAVLLNAARVLVATGAACVLAVWSGIPSANTAVLYAAVYVSLGTVQPDPTVMGRAGLFGMPAVVAVSVAYSFLVFPVIDGFPLFIVSLAPLAFATCWLVKAGKAGAGLVFGTQTLALIAPANTQALDPAAFTETATMFAVSGVAIFLSFLLVLPVDPAQRRLRLALAASDGLRRALAHADRRAPPHLSLHYDRLAQFRAWQDRRSPTRARRASAARLADTGDLDHAVRRAWRGLDAARAGADPALDARARAMLPGLAQDGPVALAGEYLEAAATPPEDAAARRADAGRSQLALMRTAAALHGMALATTREPRLLPRAMEGKL